MSNSRRRSWAFLSAAVIVVASILAPTVAWAHYHPSGSETNTFATHVLLAPGQPTCSGLALLSVTLTWTQPTDHAYVLSYELGESATSGGGGGGYTYTNVGLVTSKTVAISSGANYFVVRSVNHSWRSPVSSEQQVTGILFLAATCP